MKPMAVVSIAGLLAAMFAPPGRAQTPAQTPASGANQGAQTTSAVLLGQVIDAETGDPILDAVVTLTGRPAPARGRAAPPPPAASLFDLMAAAGGRGRQERVAADSTGRFVFRRLPASTYVVRADAPGYLANYAGPSGVGGSTASVEVRPGQTTARVSVRLWKQAVVTGVVVDEANEPVIRARVSAHRRTMDRLGRVSFTPAGTATTDDRGQYRLSGLAPGDYMVLVPQSNSTALAAGADAFMQGLLSGQLSVGEMAAAGRRGGSPMDPRAVRVGEWRLTSENVQSPATSSGGPILAYRTIFHPSALTASAAELVALRSGEERSGVDFALQPVITGRVSGSVSGPDGPASGVPVRLVSAGDRTPGAAAFLEVAGGQTGADGRFMLLAVPPGQYRVIAEREAPPDLSADLPEELASNPMMKMVLEMQRGGARTPLYGETAVSLGPGEEADVAITATEGVALTGRVEFQGGQPATPAEIARTTVALRALDGQAASARTGRADASGRFTIAGVLPGRYALSSIFRGAAGGTWLVRDVTAGGRDATSSAIVVGEKDVELVVTFTSQVGTLHGTVRRAASAGRAGQAAVAPPLTAVVVPANYAEWTDPEMLVERVRFVAVTQDDTFRIGPILTGEYLVAVVDEGQFDTSRGLSMIQSLAAQATRVTVGPSDATNVTIPIASVRR